MLRSSMIISGFTLISRIMGFVRDLAITYFMGASATIAADAYTTAFNFPNLFRRIFAEGAFAAAFVPAYSRSLEQDGEEVADKLAGDAMAVLSVSDTGPGIDPETAEQLFRPFFTTKSHGLGVGLSICRTIVEAHGGRIWVERNDRGGATFRLTLPVVREEDLMHDE